ncbi:2,3-diaminopropionate biosynthesis protein SbnA [Kitasatospora sp. NBC_01266]|uniref:2,3-diaminopropionate biosynthesis protein SbnA n=1 Tax=Kitasatospora sp. NBC_01266 TaxID=2903572 RepID=UPI002E335AD7|nr:2,3-diaminopropionate biosynthesis protein SbnA [Kitasatospora sp. NBC_01266]
MPIISAPHDFNEHDLFVDLRPSLGIPLYLKCEGMNFAGSIKQKAAVGMIEAAERAGRLGPNSILVESSSGNLGVALSLMAASKGYGFLCVTDSRCNLNTRRMMEVFGARVHTITEADPVTGLLGARLAYVRRLLESDERYVWLNQYQNPDNWGAHYRWTAPAIARQFPGLDVLFVGAGTTGTLMGCARWFKEHRPGVRIVAVDSVGSVSFGQPAAPRWIPGLGSGVRPAMLDENYVDDVRMVEEIDTVRMCHRLAAHGFLFGGSTGTAVAGAAAWLAEHDPAGRLTAATIGPDLGERYLDTVYQTNWVQDIYGSAALEQPQRSFAVAVPA